MVELEHGDCLKPDVAGAAVPGVGAQALLAPLIQQWFRVELNIDIYI